MVERVGRVVHGSANGAASCVCSAWGKELRPSLRCTRCTNCEAHTDLGGGAHWPSSIVRTIRYQARRRSDAPRPLWRDKRVEAKQHTRQSGGAVFAAAHSFRLELEKRVDGAPSGAVLLTTQRLAAAASSAAPTPEPSGVRRSCATTPIFATVSRTWAANTVWCSYRPAPRRICVRQP